MSPSYKNSKDEKHMLTLINVQEMKTFQVLNGDSIRKNGVTSSSV